jgi:hypothetical protein
VTTATRKATRAGGASARERLAFYRRYADLVRQQESALIAGDLDGFHSLADQALELQGGHGPPATPSSLPEDPGSGPGPSVGELSRILQGTLDTGERIQARLRALRSDAGWSVRRATDGQRRVRGYAPTSERDAGVRLDLTF